MRAATLAALVVALAGAAAPTGAQSYDFTITVPVNVSGLPAEITEIAVTCYVLPAASTYYSNEAVIGTSIKHTPVHGSFSGNIVLAFNANSGKDASLAAKYMCSATLNGSYRGATGISFTPGGSTPPSFPVVSGAPLYLGSVSASDLLRIPGR